MAFKRPNLRSIICQICSAGWSYNDIADKMGVTDPAVRFWMTRNSAKWDTIEKLVELRDKLQAGGRVKLTEEEATMLESLATRANLVLCKPRGFDDE